MDAIVKSVKGVSPNLELVNMVLTDRLAKTEHERETFKKIFPQLASQLNCQEIGEDYFLTYVYGKAGEKTVRVHNTGCVMIYGVKTLSELRKVHAELVGTLEDVLENINEWGIF